MLSVEARLLTASLLRSMALPVVPEMAYFGFTNKLLRGETIQIYNYGNCRRDFTNVDDIVEGIVRVMQKVPARMVQRILWLASESELNRRQAEIRAIRFKFQVS